MKTTLIRIFTIMTLATSISAFGLAEKAGTDAESKSNHSNCETAAVPARAAGNDAQTEDRQTKSDRQRLIEEQEKQWLRDVDYAR